jgi:SAM-dependent methyltransferase
MQLPTGSRILEVGCGAGHLAVELAKRGYEVEATDALPEMVELTRRHGEEANVSTQLHSSVVDAHALAFVEETFDAVIALGVIPWLHSPQTALEEVARVLKPGRYALVTANNRRRLFDLLDPRLNPALRPLKQATKRLLGSLGMRFERRSVPWRAHTLGEADELLAAAGLERITGLTVGFGPVTFLGHRLLPEHVGCRLHQRLQRTADRGVPGIRSLGAQYVVLARKASGAPG